MPLQEEKKKDLRNRTRTLLLRLEIRSSVPSPLVSYKNEFGIFNRVRLFRHLTALVEFGLFIIILVLFIYFVYRVFDNLSVRPSFDVFEGFEW